MDAAPRRKPALPGFRIDIPADRYEPVNLSDHVLEIADYEAHETR